MLDFIKKKLNSTIDYFFSDTVEPDAKVFYLMSIGGILGTAGMLFVCLIYSLNPILTKAFGIECILWLAMVYMGYRFSEYKFYSYLLSLLINLFMFPTFYIALDEINNGTPLFFCVGIIITFFLVRSRVVYVLMIAEIGWYVYLFKFTADNWKMLEQYRTSSEFGTGIWITYLLATMVCMIILIYQTAIYDRMHEQVRKSRMAIEEARVNKSRFLANMTHEIRTPMNAIIGMNELILREEINPSARELASQIKESSHQLLKIINSILEFSKLDSDKMELFPEKYDFRKLISGIVEAVANEYAKEECDFYVSIDPSIPAYLFGDDIRIRQVFMYLMFSTVRIMPHSRMSLEIIGERDSDTNTILLKCRIAEAGLGLSEVEIEAMLSAYTRYDSRLRSDYKGIGLELSICKEILERMGGTLSIDSVEDVGMAISFTLRNYIIEDIPVARIPSSKEYNILVYLESKSEQEIWTEILRGFKLNPHFVFGPNAFREAIEDKRYTHIFVTDTFFDILKDTILSAQCEECTYVVTGRGNVYSEYGKCRIIRRPLSVLNISDALNGIWTEDDYKLSVTKDAIIFPKAKVLTVDDSAVNLKVLKAILKTYGIEPDMAKNADEAVVEIKKKSYDLIILDQIMPGVDGVTLLHQIRDMQNSNSKIPIICATADFGPDVGRRLISEGFQDYLAKPVQQFYLERILRKFLPKELAENVPIENESESTPAESAEPLLNPLEVDFDLGLHNIGDNKQAFGAVLNTFYKEGLTKLETVPDEAKDEDLNLYIVDVHALKSSCASIGAKDLSTLFRELEFAGKENNRDLIDKNTTTVLGHFQNVLETIRCYLADNNMLEALVKESNEAQGEVESISLEDVYEMQDAMNKINLKRCEELINLLCQKNYGNDVNSKVYAIKNSYDMFDYHKVKDLIQELIVMIEK